MSNTEKKNVAAVLKAFEKRARRRAQLRATARAKAAHKGAAEQLHALIAKIAA